MPARRLVRIANLGWLAVVVALASVPVRGQPGASAIRDSERASALCARGLELGYNLDHEQALDAFNAAISADPSNPRPYQLAAAAIWIQLLFSQGAITVDDYLGDARAELARPQPEAAMDRTFHELVQKALDLSQQAVRAHPADAEAHYDAGAAFGFRASYTATVEGRVGGAFGSARRAYLEHQRVLELDPQRKDAGLIVGLYGYAVSVMPLPVRIMARLAGIGIGKDRALHFVEEAAGYPSDVQPNALFTLVLLYSREARYDEALAVIARLQQRFPRNRLLWLEQGTTALRAGRATDARAALEAGLDRLAHDARPRAPGETARWRYAYGASLVGVNEPALADRELHAALADATRDWLRGRIHVELGKSADLSERHSAASAEFRAAVSLCRADRDDECVRDAMRRLR